MEERIGQRVNVNRTTEALDTGARAGVFATSGGSTYLLITGFVVAGLAALVGWVFVLRNAVRRRKAPVTTPA